MSKTTKIIPLTAEDRQLYFGVVSVIEAAFGRLYSGLYTERNSVGSTIACTQEGNVIGGLIGNFTPETNTATVRFLGILPELQHTGLGKAVLREFEKQAKNRGAKRILAFTSPSLEHWYGSQGYDTNKDAQNRVTATKSIPLQI